ncbi:MAG: hypothetical protein BZY80_05950 [SAR202 cluster bacterium Io17-Chloro-G2]|nr:MAG: hypothetical protein BZY80_05950 [SAR202 cluster bacterium Io17-Chloro-G2]
MFRTGQEPDGPLSIRRRILSLPTLVSLALAAAFLIFLVTRFDLDFRATWSHIRGSDPWLVAAAFLVHYTTFPFRGARWQRLLRNVSGQDQATDATGSPVPSPPVPSPPVPSIVYCSQLVLLGWFVNSVGWFRLGDVYRAYLYRVEQAASFSRTIGTLLAERILDAVLVAALLLAVTPFLVGGDNASWVVAAMGVALVAILGSALLALVWAKSLADRVLPDWLAVRYRRFRDGTLGSFQRVPLLTFLGLLGWLAEVFRLYLVGTALGVDLSLPMVTFVALASSLLTLAPTPGGVGVVESGVVGLVVRLSGLSLDAAAAVVVVDRAISYVSVILLGAALFLVRLVVNPAKGATTAPGPLPNDNL